MFRFKKLALMTCIFLSVSGHAFTKQSINLGNRIDNVSVCKNSALVRVNDFDLNYILYNVTLGDMKATEIARLDWSSAYACDKEGGYYIGTHMDKQGAWHPTLSAYKSLDDTQPAWRFEFDSFGDEPMIHTIAAARDKIILLVFYRKQPMSHFRVDTVALDRASGKLLWKTPAEFIYTPQLSVVNDTVYVSDSSGLWEAYKMESGALKWEGKQDYYEEYTRPQLDTGSNTLITAAQVSDYQHVNAEIIGMDPATGATRWRLPDNQKLLLPSNMVPGQLVYMQAYVPVQNMFKLNWYKLQPDGEPVFQHQWSGLYNQETGVPRHVLTAGKLTLVAFSSMFAEQHVFVFDNQGNKIDDIPFPDSYIVDIHDADAENQAIYTTYSGEFGMLSF